ncbi:MAG: extracellular solute-binding protein [Planctomycetota bacterium]
MKSRSLILGFLVLLGGALGLALLGPQGKGQGTLVVYSAHSQSDLDRLIPRFEAATGIQVELINLGSADVVQRLLAERGAPRCDVVWSVGGEQPAAQPELWEAYAPPGLAEVAEPFRVDGAWLPYTAIVSVLAVNTGLVPEGERPQGWRDLRDPRFEEHLVSARADRSGSAYLQLVTVLQACGPDGWEVYAGLLANAVLTPGSSAVCRLVNDGEAWVGITLEDNARRYVEGNVAVVYPTEGTIAAPDGIALVKGAPHPEAAKRFADWALSQETQAFLAQEIGRRSVRADVPPPPGLPPLGELTLLPYDLEDAALRREGNVGRWTDLLRAQARGE